MASLADPGRGGKQEVARARARALRPRACAYWREEEDDKGEEVGWAGQGGELGRLGWTGKRQVSLLLRFIFFLSSVLFYLIYFATVLNLK